MQRDPGFESVRPSTDHFIAAQLEVRQKRAQCIGHDPPVCEDIGSGSTSGPAGPIRTTPFALNSRQMFSKASVASINFSFSILAIGRSGISRLR